MCPRALVCRLTRLILATSVPSIPISQMGKTKAGDSGARLPSLREAALGQRTLSSVWASLRGPRTHVCTPPRRPDREPELRGLPPPPPGLDAASRASSPQPASPRPWRASTSRRCSSSGRSRATSCAWAPCRSGCASGPTRTRWANCSSRASARRRRWCSWRRRSAW